MAIIKTQGVPVTLRADVIDAELIQLLETRYDVVVEQRGNNII